MHRDGQTSRLGERGESHNEYSFLSSDSDCAVVFRPFWEQCMNALEMKVRCSPRVRIACSGTYHLLLCL